MARQETPEERIDRYIISIDKSIINYKEKIKDARHRRKKLDTDCRAGKHKYTEAFGVSLSGISSVPHLSCIYCQHSKAMTQEQLEKRKKSIEKRRKRR